MPERFPVRPLRLAALLLGLAACADEAAEPAADAPPPSTVPAVDPAPAPDGDWSVSVRGAGPARIGMSWAELAPLLAPGVDTAAIGGGCEYVPVAGAPDDLLFMVEGGRLVRVDVRGGSVATAEGARVGDPEERVLSLYPGAVRQPHKYTEGSYLVARPEAPSDTLRRVVFETDGSRVTRYRAGLFPQVEWVEGCA